MGAQVNLERWVPHLEAAGREGLTLSRYAREHGLSKHTLYAARQGLVAQSKDAPGKRSKRLPTAVKREPLVISKPARVPAFSAVKMVNLAPVRRGPAPGLRIKFPGGARLELTGADAELLAAAVRSLAGH